MKSLQKKASPSLMATGSVCAQSVDASQKTLAAPNRLQAKLTVNTSRDKYEQEADRVAEQLDVLDETGAIGDASKKKKSPKTKPNIESTNVSSKTTKKTIKGLGYSGRVALGETKFTGLVRNRRLADLTHNEIFNAFRKTNLTPDDHAIQRMLGRSTKKDIKKGAPQVDRIQSLGMETLGDLERLLNNGRVYGAGGGSIAVVLGQVMAIVNPSTRVLETIRHVPSRILRSRTRI